MTRTTLSAVLLAVTVLGCRPSAKDVPKQRPPEADPATALTIPQDDSPTADESVKGDLMDRLNKAGLSRVADDLASLAQPSIRIKTQRSDDQRLEVGASKIGGVPDLPETIRWPRWKGTPLTFIAQFKMGEVAKHDVAGQLPRSGMLYFFYETTEQPWGFDPKDRGGWRVLYSDATGTDLRRAEPPDDLPEESRFDACKLTFTTEPTPPPWESIYVERLDLSEEEADKYLAVLYPKGQGDGIRHRLLGHADPIQGDMQLECQLTFHGLYTGDATGYEDPRRPELEKGATEWQLLLQIDSDEDNAGMMWGDLGRIYFWIRKQDLQKRAFENVWMVLQCY
jgi:uncharacterized protein YwqG